MPRAVSTQAASSAKARDLCRPSNPITTPRVAASGLSREDVIDARNARVPLRAKMGTAWDTAYAALFLASDEARFITGAALAVDGGTSLRVG